MGKASLIWVLAVALSVSIYTLGIRARGNQSQDVASKCYDETMARTTAASSAEIAVRDIVSRPTGYTKDTTYSIDALNGGSASVAVKMVTKDSMRVSCVSSYGRIWDDLQGVWRPASSTVSLTLARGGAIFPTGAMTVSANTDGSLKGTGVGVWTGVDYTAPGASWNNITTGNPPKPSVNASGKSVDGISYGVNSNVKYLAGNQLFTAGLPVKGIRATPANADSAALGGTQPDYYNMAMALVNDPRTVKITSGSSSQMHFGTTTNPQITYIQGNLTFSASDGGDGCGVLIIDGNVSFNGNPTFQGLIIILDNKATGGESTFTQTNSNDMNICGAIILAGPKATFQQTSSISNIWYSSQAIQNYVFTPFLGGGVGSGQFALKTWFE